MGLTSLLFIFQKNAVHLHINQIIKYAFVKKVLSFQKNERIFVKNPLL